MCDLALWVPLMSLEVLKGGLFKRELTPKDKSDVIENTYLSRSRTNPDLRFAQRHSLYFYVIIYRL